MACNTMSAHSFDIVKKLLNVPVIEVIGAGASTAVAETRNKKLGIIGTSATINSGVYQKAINKLDNNIETYQRACPLFVPLVEEGLEWWKNDITLRIAQEYLTPLKQTGVDTLVLGCTHYPLLLDKIKKYVPSGITIISQGEYVATSLANYLHKHPEMEERCTKGGSCHFLTTEYADKFEKSASLFLEGELKVTHTSIEDL